jgi:hypothetical protein
MSSLLSSIHRQYPLLSWSFLYQLILLAASIVGLVIDGRRVTGINPWIKPVKFEISVAVFLLTLGWLLLLLPGFESAKQWIANLAAIAMIVEITAIVVQAARGVKSHFNFDTPFDAAIFSLMGLFIMVNTAAVLILAILYFLTSPDLPPAVTWGIRLGLLLFLASSAQGFLIVRNRAHTVGAPDGGAGLFFLNWSLRHGDLRIAHFAGMHAIQILPALGWALSRADRDAGVAAVFAVFAMISGAFVWTLQQALRGRPLIGL